MMKTYEVDFLRSNLIGSLFKRWDARFAPQTTIACHKADGFYKANFLSAYLGEISIATNHLSDSKLMTYSHAIISHHI